MIHAKIVHQGLLYWKSIYVNAIRKVSKVLCNIANAINRQQPHAHDDNRKQCNADKRENRLARGKDKYGQ